MRFTVLFLALVLAVLHVDMYQDRLDPDRTVIVIETDEGTETISVDNNKLDDTLVEKIVRKYGQR